MFLQEQVPKLHFENAVTTAFRFDPEAFSAGQADALGVRIPQVWQHAVPKRKADFVAGRWAALRGLDQLGVSQLEIGINKHRAPIWPKGIVGSVTHAGNYAAAMVASSAYYGSIGIDSETLMDERQAEEIAELIFTNAEKGRIGQIPIAFHVAATLIFSAKESIYKCLHPLIEEFLDFPDVEIDAIDVETKTFHYHVLRKFESHTSLQLSGSGIFAIDENIVHTALAAKSLFLNSRSPR